MRTSIISPKGGVNCTRRGLLLLLAVVVLLAIIAPAAAAVGSAEKAPKHPAASTSGRCASGVREYLVQAMTRRAEAAASEARARAELNEARSILEEEKSGQREPKGDTEARVRGAWSKFESASAAMKTFDEAVLKTHGKLPLKCILEVDALRGTGPGADSWVGQTTHALEKVALHLRLYGETLRGVVLFNLAEYASAVSFYHEVVDVFGAKSQQAYEEIQQRKNKGAFEGDGGGLSELAGLALMYVRFVALALVPWATLFSVCVLLVVFAPFLLSAVLLPQLVWRVWVQLFFLRYTYGLTVDGLLVSLQQYFQLLTQKDWAGLQERFLAALAALTTAEGTAGTFFNGLLAAALVASTVVLLLVFIYYWVRLPYSLMVPAAKGGDNRHVRRQPKKGIPPSGTPLTTGGGAAAAAMATNAGRKDKAPAPAGEPARYSAKLNSGFTGGDGGSSAEKNRKKKA